MITLRQLAAEPLTLSMQTTWYLTDLAEAKGKQELFTRQSPQKLKVLREHALIESAVSSNRIEGVEVDQSRITTLLFGKSALRDRDEEEVRGYRDALKLIHENGAKLSISEATIKTLHKLSRGEIWDAGAYKAKDVDIIQTYADGRSRVRFKTVPAAETPLSVATAFQLFHRCQEEQKIPFQLSQMKGGGTDGGAIHVANAGCPTIVLTIPTRHIHSHVGMLSLDDVDNAIVLLIEVVKRLDSKTVDSFTMI